MTQDIDQVARDVTALQDRMLVVEAWKHNQVTNNAVRDVRDQHVDIRFDRIEKGLNEIKGYMLKVVWVIIVGILAAFVTFMVRGGLNVPI